MADNLTLNAGEGGASLATDEISAIHHQRVKVQHGADGSATDVSTASPLPSYNAGIESAGNSSSTLLTGSATFTGSGEVNGHSHVGVQVKTDAAGTLYFDFSTDGTNWDSTYPVNGFRVAAGISEFHTAVKLGRYFRVRLVNGSDAQTYLRLKTYYGSNFTPSVAPLNQSAGLDSDAIFTRSTIPSDEIRIGRRGGVTGWTKFGYNEDVDASPDEVIWAGGATFTPMATAGTFTIAYTLGTDGADAGATGALTLAIYYIDSDGLPAIGTHTLGSDGSDVTSFSGLGINRVAVASSGTANANVNDITITATTGGSQQAIVPAGGSVTQQAIFFTGSNHDAVAKFLLLNVNKISGGGSPRVTIKGFVFNRQFATDYEVFRYTMDTAVENSFVLDEPVGFNLSPTDVLYFSADSDTANTVVNVRFSLVEYQRS